MADDELQVLIALEARDRASDAIELENAELEALKERLDAVRDAGLESAGSQDVLQEILDQVRDAAAEAASSNEFLDQILAAIRDHSLEAAAALEAMVQSLQEARDAQLEAAGAADANATATSAQAAAAAQAAGAGGPLIAVLIGIGIAAAIAVTPFVAFITAAIGATVVLGLFVGGVGLAAAAMIALSVATGTTTKQVKDAHGHVQTITVYTNQAAAAWAHLTDELGKAAHALGGEVAPIAAQFIGLLSQLVPIAVQVVQPIIHAFSLITPALIPVLKVLGVDFLRAVGQVGLVFAIFASDILSRQGAFESLFNLLTSQGVQALMGLLDNLLRLSDWFFQELPSLGPPVGGFFSLLGRLVQGGISIVQRFAEWVGEHWPQIANFFTQVGQAVQQGFQAVGPVVGAAVGILQHLGPVLQFIHDHANELKPILMAVGIAAAIIVGAFLLLAGAVLLLVGGLTGLFLIGDKVVNWLKTEVPAGLHAAGQEFSKLASEAGQAIGKFFSGLGSEAQKGVRAIGSGFSAIGSAIHNALTAAIRVAAGLWREFWSQPGYFIGLGIGTVLGGMYSLVNKAEDLALQLVEAIGREWLKLTGEAPEAAKNVIQGFYNGWVSLSGWVVKQVTHWAEQIGNEWLKLTGEAPTAGRNIIQGLYNGWQQLSDWVIDQVNEWGQRLYNTWLTLTSDAMSIGKQIVQGIWNGFQSLTGWLTTQVNGFVSGLLHGAIAAIPGGAAAAHAAGIPGFAAGGDYPAGTVAVVGERGPELFVSGTSGSIIPNNALSAATSGPSVYNVTFNILGASDPMATAAVVDHRLSHLLNST